MQVADHQSLRVAVTGSRAKVFLRWRRMASRKAATRSGATAGAGRAARDGFFVGRALATGFDRGAARRLAAGFFGAGFFFFGMVGG